MTTDFSVEIIIAGRKWYSVFQVPKENNCEPVKLFFRDEVEIKSFLDKKGKGILTSRSTLKA